MRKTYQKGFGSVGLLLILVVLAAAGAVGYYTYKNNQKNQEAAKPAAQTAVQPSTPAQPAKIQHVALSKLPADLRAAIIAETKTADPACVKNGAIVDIDGKATDQSVQYTTDGFALTGIGCDGSQVYLLAKTGGTWQKVDATQLQFKCENLKKYKVPASFIKASFSSPDTEVECVSADPAATKPEIYK